MVGGEWPAQPQPRLRGLEGKGEELGLRAGLGQRRERARRGEGEGELGLRRCWARWPVGPQEGEKREWAGWKEKGKRISLL